MSDMTETGQADVAKVNMASPCPKPMLWLGASLGISYGVPGSVLVSPGLSWLGSPSEPRSSPKLLLVGGGVTAPAGTSSCLITYLITIDGGAWEVKIPSSSCQLVSFCDSMAFLPLSYSIVHIFLIAHKLHTYMSLHPTQWWRRNTLSSKLRPTNIGAVSRSCRPSCTRAGPRPVWRLLRAWQEVLATSSTLRCPNFSHTLSKELRLLTSWLPEPLSDLWDSYLHTF